MSKLSTANLMTLEAYAKARPQLRAEVLAHKKNRTLSLGEHITLIFEDEMTIRYQIQEMLRVERVFEEAGIQEELDAYNPLIPDGGNWKATMLIEYPDVDQRQTMLAKLKNIEHHVWVQVTGQAKISAIADEDLERSNEDKTSAVHFLRFELDATSVGAIKQGSDIAIGVSHPAYAVTVPTLAPALRAALAKDLS